MPFKPESFSGTNIVSVGFLIILVGVVVRLILTPFIGEMSVGVRVGLETILPIANLVGLLLIIVGVIKGIFKFFVRLFRKTKSTDLKNTEHNPTKIQEDLQSDPEHQSSKAEEPKLLKRPLLKSVSVKNILKSKTLFAVSIVLVAGYMFYWYEIRPSQIKESCVQKVLDSGSDSKEDFDWLYKYCLRKSGL